MMRKKREMVKLIGLLFMSVLIAAGCVNKEKNVGESKTEKAANSVETSKMDLEDSKLYLEHFFDVKFENAATKEDINAAIHTIFGEDSSSIDGDFNSLTFIKAINQASGFEELSLTYSDEKAKKALEKIGADEELDPILAKYVAASIDANLLDTSTVKNLISAKEITSDLAVLTLMEAVNASGLGRNYLGFSNDSNIYQKLYDSWGSFILFNDQELSQFAANLVEEETITGYNLKLNSYNPNFLPEKTLSYGHSDMNHAIQLIGLLNSEDLVAKVQLEPKVSVFEYLPEWGPIPDPTPMYKVEEVGSLLLANAVEYDLVLEFLSTKDLEKFDQVVDKYAKKNEENKGEGLLISSWWQPFLLTTNEKMPTDRFFEVYDSSASNEMYTLRTVVLKEDKDNIENKFKELQDLAETEMERKYTNLAFYNYLQGIDYE